MTAVLVVGADERVLAAALAEAGAEDAVIVLDPSALALEAVERALPDPRVWYQVGDGEVVPLPDASVDCVVGPRSPDVERVLR